MTPAFICLGGLQLNFLFIILFQLLYENMMIVKECLRLTVFVFQNRQTIKD